MAAAQPVLSAGRALMDAERVAAHNRQLEARFGESLARMRALEVPDPAGVRVLRDLEFSRPDGGAPLLIEGLDHGFFNGRLFEVRPCPPVRVRTNSGGVERELDGPPATFELIERFLDRHLRKDLWTWRPGTR